MVKLRGALVLLVVASLPAAARAQDFDDNPPDEPAAPPLPADAKPVPFDRTWLEPYFQYAPFEDAARRFRIEDWSGAAAAFDKALAKAPRPGRAAAGGRRGTAAADAARAALVAARERDPARFLRALALENAASGARDVRWKAAGTELEALWTSYPRLGPYHAWHAARCRLQRGDAPGALTWAAKVPTGTVPEPEALLIQIDALRALGRWTDLANLASDFVARFPRASRKAEVLFRRAQALEKLGKPVLDVVPLYRRVWTEAPLDPLADEAGKRIADLAASLPPESGAGLAVPSASQWLGRGMAFFERNRNAESEAAFAHALEAPGRNPDLDCQARYHRAQSVWKQRQRARAAPLFDEAEAACREPAFKDLHAKALYQGARCHASQKDWVGATSRFARVETEHPEHTYADDARLRAAEVAVEAGDDAAAEALLKDIPERYPKGDQVGEALWRLAFTALRAGRDDAARAFLDDNLRRIPHEDQWYAEGRAHYWKGRLLERAGHRDQARAAYERAIREYPLSVYALWSLVRLDGIDPRARTALIDEMRADMGDGAPPEFPPQPLYGAPGFATAIELARLGLGAETRRELGRLGLGAVGRKGRASTERDASEDLLWIAAVLLDRAGVWSASHGIPRYTLTAWKRSYPRGANTLPWRLAYPRGFPELVEKNTRAVGLPEALQLAIVREESAWNPRTESFANAIGLTQMIIPTARRFADGLIINRELLQDPARNLEVGSRFLAFLWKHYREAAPLAIAGYNAGEGAVDRWLKERGTLDLDAFVETIPYDETRNYTKRVLASYFAYSWLYGKDPVPPLRLEPPRP